MDITLCPFPPDRLSSAWKWIREYPEANMDDFGPKTYAQFEGHMLQRMKTEIVCGVRYKNRLVGIIGYIPSSPRSGMFHGICFARAVHGLGVAREAVQIFLKGLFKAGVEKVSAGYFADNARIRKFFQKLGAVDEGYLKQHTLRNGQLIDYYLVALFKDTTCLLVAH